MKFANPLFLWGILSIAVPIIIHLFHFRRFKTVYFTNVKFLKAVQQENIARSRLKHLLVLLARCLALIALALAFARPFIPSGTVVKSGSRAVSIYLDNSFSMDARGESGSLFEIAQNRAREIALAYQPSDRFQLITNDLESRHQRWLNREQFVEMLQELKLSASSRRISEVVKRQKDLFAKESFPNKSIFLISDFQKGISDISKVSPDSTIQLNCIKLNPEVAANVSIDSIWFDQPFRKSGVADKISIRLRNFSSAGYYNQGAQLFVDSVKRGIETINLGPDSVSTIQVNFTTPQAGLHSGSVQLTDYPITFDDEFYFSYLVQDSISVLRIFGDSKRNYIKQFYSSNPTFNYEELSVGSVNYSQFQNFEIIILDQIPEISSGFTQELKKFVSSGGSILIFPSMNKNVDSWEIFSRELQCATYGQGKKVDFRVSSINSLHPVYDDVFEKQPGNRVDLPSIQFYYPLRLTGKSAEEYLMQLPGKEAFLLQTELGKGKIIQCASAPEDESSNFPRHSLFIPTLYKIALLSAPRAQLYSTIGSGLPIELTGVTFQTENVLKLKSLEGDFEIIPDARFSEGRTLLFEMGQIQKAGNYVVLQEGKEIATVSYNYDRVESDLAHFSEAELTEQLESIGWLNNSVLDGSMQEIGKEIRVLDEGRPLWKLFLILALIFLAIEILFIRFLK